MDGADVDWLRPRLRGVAPVDASDAVGICAAGGLMLRCGAAIASAESRAARLVGAGGRGMMLKTLFGV